MPIRDSKDEEQQRVTDVVKAVDHQQVEKEKQLEKAHNETKKIEQNYGDNTRVNITEVDDRMETNAAVQQQKQLVARTIENETIIKEQLDRLTQLADSPYFGRIDIDEDGDQESLYIGTATFIDEDNQFLVYDWRAPISSIYYNGTLGRVTYDTPNGQMDVDLKLKRQFQISDAKINNMFDTEDVVGDEILQSVLGQQNDVLMHNIVATIQKEQNDIIRNTSADLLIVQGVAGSGKTSAILQRIAYLLYHSRSHLNSEQMILFSPNRLFSHYISDVLPSLGEKNTRQVTLAEFLANRFSGLHVETLFDRFEKDQAHFPKSAQKIRQYKESIAFMDAVKDYCKSPELTPAFIDIRFEGETIFTKEHILLTYQRLPHLMQPADKFHQTKNQLIKELKRFINRKIHDPQVLDEVNLLSEETYQRIIGEKQFENESELVDYLAKTWLKEKYQSVYELIYNDYFIDIYQQYGYCLASLKPSKITKNAWQGMIDSYYYFLESHQLNLDDAAPLLYMRDLLTGSGQNHSMQQLFIDEMQDYSPAQLQYIHHAFPVAKLTLLGDTSQDVFNTGDTKQPLKDFIDQFSPAKTTVISLNKSYRATQPITNFAKALLINGDHIQAFNRDGVKPKVKYATKQNRFIALNQAVDELIKDNETVAILTKTQAEAEQVFATLKTETDVTLLEDYDRTLPKGIVVLPIYLAKGLEFDAVIGYNVSKNMYETDHDRDLLYTLATRAMHDLTLITIDQPSPFLTEIDPELFESETVKITN